MEPLDSLEDNIQPYEPESVELTEGGCAACAAAASYSEPSSEYTPEEWTPLEAETDDLKCACAEVHGAAEGGARPRAHGQGSNELSGHWALAGLGLDKGECAEDPNRKSGEPCSKGRVLEAISQFVEKLPEGAAGDEPKKAELLPAAESKAAQDVREAAAALQCNSESCVLSHPAFVKFAKSDIGLTSGELAAEKERRFKAAGPRHGAAWLNNHNIDETLQRWARVFPEFFAYPFAMMDFDKTGEPLAELDVGDILDGKVAQKLGPGFGEAKRPARVLACVLNTDVSSGPGKHWVALLVDARAKKGRSETASPGTWTVEYFNSAGRPPPKPVVVWMEKTRARLEEWRKKHPEAGAGPVETVPVTSVSHQEGQSECGVYSCFYIRKRLEGTPISFFQGERIPDEVMSKFREFVFRDKS